MEKAEVFVNNDDEGKVAAHLRHWSTQCSFVYIGIMIISLFEVMLRKFVVGL